MRSWSKRIIRLWRREKQGQLIFSTINLLGNHSLYASNCAQRQTNISIQQSWQKNNWVDYIKPLQIQGELNLEKMISVRERVMGEKWGCSPKEVIGTSIWKLFANCELFVYFKKHIKRILSLRLALVIIEFDCKLLVVFECHCVRLRSRQVKDRSGGH